MSSPAEYVYVDELIRDREWDDVVRAIRTREGKRQLSSQSKYGDLPLHEACKGGAPLRLMRAMVRACPEAVEVPDGMGYLPLHYVCGLPDVTAQVQVARLFLRTHPGGAEVANDMGELPLHLAAHIKPPVKVLKMLLDAHPEGVSVRDDDGDLPIHLGARGASPDNDEDVERVRALLEPILNSEEACLVSDRESGTTALDIAAKTNMFSLHTLIRTRNCPPDVMLKAARLHPERLREKDKNGNLPLHIAAANADFNGTQVVCVRSQDESGDNDGDDESDGGANDDEMEVEHQEARNDREGAGDDAEGPVDLIGELVKLYPGAAAALNGETKFPLSLAIESGKKWHEGVEAIAGAAKHVCLIKDESADLYPFMLATTVDDACLTTVYKLLRLCPELKKYAIN